MEVAFFVAKCNKCGALFETPLLSDFSYGEFIARSEDGRITAYLNAIEELSFNEISSLFEELFKKYGTGLKENSCFHFVIGKCSDRIEGQEMRIDIGPICPNCRSNCCDYKNLRMAGKRDTEKLSFKAFISLKEDEKKELIKAYINQLKNS